MGGRGGRDLPIVGGVEQQGKIAGRTPPGGDLEHGAHQESHHVMEEPVGFDLKREPAGAVDPPRHAHVAAMVIAGGRGALNRERPKPVLAHEQSRRGVERAAIHRTVYGDFVSAAKG